MKDFFTSVGSDVVARWVVALITLGGPVVYGLLKKFAPRWAGIVPFALLCTGLTLGIYLLVVSIEKRTSPTPTAPTTISESTTPHSPEWIEDKLVEWLWQEEIVPRQTKPTPDDLIFHYSFEFRGQAVNVELSNTDGKTLQFQEISHLDTQTVNWMASLSPRGRSAVATAIRQELYTSNLQHGFNYENEDPNFIKTFTIRAEIPIEELSKYELFRTLRYITGTRELILIRILHLFEVDTNRRMENGDRKIPES